MEPMSEEQPLLAVEHITVRFAGVAVRARQPSCTPRIRDTASQAKHASRLAPSPAHRPDAAVYIAPDNSPPRR